MSNFLNKIGLKSEKILLINCPKNFKQLYFEGNSHSNETVSSEFSIAFVYNIEDVEEYVPRLVKCASPTGKIWIAYPKKSGVISTDLSRDKGWEILDSVGYRGISLISLDEDWSVMRIRPRSEIQSKPKRLYDVPPQELVAQLSEFPEAMEYYEQLAPSHKKEYNMWIMEAKKSETKKRRLDKMIEMLLSRKKNPFEK